MVGKYGSLSKKSGYLHLYYRCSQANTSRAWCAYPQGHEAGKIEEAVLEYLGQFNNPAKVREHLLAVGENEVLAKRDELHRVELRLGALEEDYQTNLDLLKRGILDEASFMAADQQREDDRATIEVNRANLAGWLEAMQEASDAADALPAKIGSFLEGFEKLETRRAKALLQPILKAVRVYREGRLEVEFRVKGRHSWRLQGVVDGQPSNSAN